MTSIIRTYLVSKINFKMSKQTSTIIIAILAVLLLVMTFLYFNKSSQATDLGTKTEKQDTLIDSLTNMKFDLLEEIDSLELAYGVMAATSDSLSSAVADANDRVKRRDSQIRKLKRETASTAEGLQSEIAQLQQMRGQMQDVISQLQSENEALRAQNETLTGELTTTTQQKEELEVEVSGLQEENLTLKGDRDAKAFRATGFQVTPLRKNDKQTTKGKRARSLDVNFNLNDVPEAFRGKRTLYLVITDSTGSPLEVENPINAKIKSGDGSVMEIIAQQTQEANLVKDQEISFNQELPRKTPGGTYRVAIFADTGLLGAANFRMN